MHDVDLGEIDWVKLISIFVVIWYIIISDLDIIKCWENVVMTDKEIYERIDQIQKRLDRFTSSQGN